MSKSVRTSHYVMWSNILKKSYYHPSSPVISHLSLYLCEQNVLLEAVQLLEIWNVQNRRTTHMGRTVFQLISRRTGGVSLLFLKKSEMKGEKMALKRLTGKASEYPRLSSRNGPTNATRTMFCISSKRRSCSHTTLSSNPSQTTEI